VAEIDVKVTAVERTAVYVAICAKILEFPVTKTSIITKTPPNALEDLKLPLELLISAKKALKTLVAKALTKAAGLVLKGFCCIIKDRKSPMNGISSKKMKKSCIFSAI
jgi:hypothetical protein